MRSVVSFLLLALLNFNVSATDNITVFSNSGYRFWVIINGEKINTKATEKVSFSKKPGSYKLRVIIDNRDNEDIDDATDSPIEIKENFNHLFEVSVDELFSSQFPNGNKKKSVTLKKYSLINTDKFSGKWNLTINNSKIEGVKIDVLESGMLTETANINITGKDGNAYMTGTLNRTLNVINIDKVTEAFYNHIKDKLYILYSKTYRCDWFYYSFNTTFFNSGTKKYATRPTEFYYYLTNSAAICDNKEITKYDKYNIQLNMSLER